HDEDGGPAVPEVRHMAMDASPSLLARIDYCPLHGRPRLRWPNDARLAFWVIPNVEYYQYTPPGVQIGRSGLPAPEMPAYTSRNYGNRVGFWRMLDVLDRHRIRCTRSEERRVGK